MDVHRCRFVPHPPQTITALAFTHASDPLKPAPSELRLALSRESGDIEIWNPLGGKWLQESILRGSAGKTIDQLAWTLDYEVDEVGKDSIAKPGRLRLFSCNGTPRITEWDVAQGTTKRHAEGNFGDLWCFAAQPAYKLPKDGKVDDTPPSQLLAAGCGDGSIIMFSTEDDDLRFLRLLAPSPGKRQKVLSIAWRDRNTLVAGFEAGVIKVFDVNERRVIRNMTLGKTAEGGKSIVWSLRCLADGTIMSGDSSGELKIWDSKNFSCTQRLKTHQGDILDIVSNAKGDIVFTVAVDRRTVAYKPIAASQGQKARRWTRLMHRRYHDHDVNCAASYESKGMSFVVTGGKDTSPVVLPMQNWQTEYHRTLPHLPQRPQMSASPKSRLMISWWQRDIQIYHVPKRSQDGTTLLDAGIEEQKDYDQLATLRLSGDDHIQSAQISHDGKYIIASSATGVRLFQLRKTSAGGTLSIRTRPIDLPISLQKFGARHISFSTDGNWILAVRLDNTIVLAKLVHAEDAKERPSMYAKVVKLNRKSRNQQDNSLGTYTENINTVAFSLDSRVLAVGDLSGRIDTWILEGHEDTTLIPSDTSSAKSSSSSSDSDSDSDSDDEDSESPIIHGQRWIRSFSDTIYPRLDSAILALSFRPAPPPSHSSHAHDTYSPHSTRHTPHPLAHTHPSSTSLIAITATHSLTELDITTGSLTPWSRRNPSSLLPTNFTRILDRVMGVFWDTGKAGERERLWMYGRGWMYMLDLGYDLAPPTAQSHTPPAKSGQHQAAATAVEQEQPSSPNKKRKRRPSHSQSKGTGAGQALKPQDRSAIGYGPFAVRYKGTGESSAIDMIDLDDRLQPLSDDDDAFANAGADGASNALIRLRRGEQQDQDGDLEMTDDHETHGDGRGSSGKLNGGRKVVRADGPNKIKSCEKGKDITHWGTFHYRDILGVAVLSDPFPSSSSSTTASNSKTRNANGDGDENIDLNSINAIGDLEGEGEAERSPNALEIIVVERPMHDVELPPRFDGGQDWDT